MAKNQLVSVVMPTFKCGRFIRESIESVISQTYKNWELIIVDDNSGDGTVEIVRDMMGHDDRILLFQNPQN